jgi:hypothetical protein
MVEKRNAYMLLMGKLEGMRPPGRPRRRWLDNIRMDLVEMGWVMWTGLVWLRIGTGGELLWIRYWNFGFNKMLVAFIYIYTAKAQMPYLFLRVCKVSADLQSWLHETAQRVASRRNAPQLNSESDRFEYRSELAG